MTAHVTDLTWHSMRYPNPIISSQMIPLSSLSPMYSILIAGSTIQVSNVIKRLSRKVDSHALVSSESPVISHLICRELWANGHLSASLTRSCVFVSQQSFAGSIWSSTRQQFAMLKLCMILLLDNHRSDQKESEYGSSVNRTSLAWIVCRSNRQVMLLRTAIQYSNSWAERLISWACLVAWNEPIWRTESFNSKGQIVGFGSWYVTSHECVLWFVSRDYPWDTIVNRILLR